MQAEMFSTQFVAAVVVKWAMDAGGGSNRTPQQLADKIERQALEVRSECEFGDFPDTLFDSEDDLKTVYNWLCLRDALRIAQAGGPAVEEPWPDPFAPCSNCGGDMSRLVDGVRWHCGHCSTPATATAPAGADASKCAGGN